MQQIEMELKDSSHIDNQVKLYYSLHVCISYINTKFDF